MADSRTAIPAVVGTVGRVGTDDASGDDLKAIIQEQGKRRYLLLQVVKIIIFIPMSLCLAKIFGICRVWNMVFAIMRLFTCLISGSAAEPKPPEGDASFRQKALFCITKIGYEMGTCGSLVTGVLASVAVRSVMFWFIHWREFEAEAEYFSGSWTTIFHSCNCACIRMKHSYKEGRSSRSWFRALACFRGFLCGAAILALEAQSIYQVYSFLSLGNVLVE